MKLALGTAQFGLPYGVANHSGQVSLEDAKTIISLARSLGIDTIDTAVDYGTSEKVLGNVGVSEFQIITKIPGMGHSESDLNSQIQAHVLNSLRSLKISKLGGLLLHRPDELLTPIGPAIWRALNALKEQDLVEKIGYSIYSPTQLDAIYELYPADIVQAPYNIVDRRICLSGWIEKLNTKGVEVHVRSVFLQGLLLMRSDKRPKKFNEWHELWRHWDDWLKLNSLSPLEAAMKFVLSNKYISRIVVGVDSPNQLLEIIESTKTDLPLLYPKELSSESERLVNPSNWNYL
jgi:aryl-alcohol dehydrogenase-like predicted oxidoreductase